MASTNMSVAVCLLLLGVLIVSLPCGQSIGVCYGMLGNNLPPPEEVINMYKSLNIGRMRLYSPNFDVLQAVKWTNIEVVLGVTNEDVEKLASNPTSAADWVQINVKAYLPGVKFRYISVGNEMIPKDGNAQYVLPAMKNIYNELVSAGLQDQIKVSTVVDMGVLGQSYPPSTGAFTSDSLNYLGGTLKFLQTTNAPLLANVYPYMSYVSDPKDISPQYAMFTASAPSVKDGPYEYYNLFDAMVDALHAAMENVGISDVDLVVSETGWPYAGRAEATIENAHRYNSNMIKHVVKGTPRRPGKEIETYIFAMFNENQKTPPGEENNYGLFYPNKQPVYPIST